MKLLINSNVERLFTALMILIYSFLGAA